MEHLFFLSISAVIVFILSVVCYFIFFRSEGPLGSSKKERKRLVVLFIDAPDPDNPAASAAIAKHILTTRSKSVQTDLHLHIVLTGRPVDLKTRKTMQGALLLEDLLRKKWEKNDPFHSQRVLEDAAARLENYLDKCKVENAMVTIYDGGVAPCAPLSDQVHDWDFLFDRKDLITGQEVNKGDILSHKEYQQLVDKFNDLSEAERSRQLLSTLRSYSLVPLSVLKDKMEDESYSEILVYLGGPATAVVRLFRGKSREKMRQKVVELHGMFGALEPRKGTLLHNQFNVACDVESACELFVSNLFPHAEKYLVTTETAKSSVLRVSSEELSQHGIASYFVDLQALWEAVHGGKPQPIFDVIPVMTSLAEFRSQFQWSRKKAVLQELKKPGEKTRQIFLFADSDNSQHILVSGDPVQEEELRGLFLKFLQEAWS